MWRELRLVVDNGVHAQRWSREPMVEYFHKYASKIQTGRERYIGGPRQASACKLGPPEILKLRAEGREKPGRKSDIRGFHDEVLGSVPCPWTFSMSEWNPGLENRQSHRKYVRQNSDESPVVEKARRTR